MEHDRVVGHHCLGQIEALLQVEVHLQGQRFLCAIRCPVVRAEPDRQHRRWCDRAVRDRGGDLGVPEQWDCRSRRTRSWSRCSSARPGTRRVPRTAPTLSIRPRRPALRWARSPHHSFGSHCGDVLLVVSGGREQHVGVGAGSYPARRMIVARCRCLRAPCRVGGTSPSVSCLASAITPRARTCSSSTSSATEYTGATQVSAGPSTRTHSSRGWVVNAVRKSTRIWSCTSSSSWCPIHFSQSSSRHRFAKNGRLDRTDGDPLAVAALVGVVAGVAPGEDVVTWARHHARRQVLVDVEAHHRQHAVGDRHVEVVALAGATLGG